jgi:hypothetical protein
MILKVCSLVLNINNTLGGVEGRRERDEEERERARKRDGYFQGSVLKITYVTAGYCIMGS